MSEAQGEQLKCPRCDHVHSTAVDNCTACGSAMDHAPASLAVLTEWSARRDSLKTRWVAVVIAFWVSAAVLGILFFIDGRVDLVLVSICLGLLLLGVWLKARYQLHLRKGADRH